MKSFFRNISTAVTAYGRAFSFIHTHQMWGFVLIPALISLVVYGALLALVLTQTTLLSDGISHWVHADTVSGRWGNLLRGALEWVIRLLVLVVYFKIFRYVVLIISAPAMALVAERTQEILTGISHPFDRAQFVSDVWRGIRLSLRNVLTEWLITIPLYFLLLVPVFNLLVGIVILLIESYFIGFSMMDYRNEFLRISGRDSRRLIRQHRGIAVGTGLVFTLLLAIPFLGVLFAPTLAVVAAALAMERVLATKKILSSETE